MKKFMKRSMKLMVFSVIIFVAALISTKAEAASYPMLFPDSYEMSATVGDIVEIKYSYYPAFTNESVTVNVYDQNGYLVASSEKSFYHTNTLVNYTVNWDTDGYTPGRYKVVATCRFYSYYEWHEAPSSQTHYIQLEDAACRHNFKTSTTKATLTKDGKTVKTCTLCGEKESTKIYKVNKISLSEESFVYNGKTKTPKIVVKNSKGTTLKRDTDYTVKFSGDRKNIGEYKVIITLKGKYSGSKTLYFKIVPGKTSNISATQTTSTITLKWNKVSGATSYGIYKYNSSTKKYELIKTVSATSCKIYSLKSGTVYKFKIKAIKKIDGNTFSGTYSSVFETATKAKTPTIKVTSTKKGVASLSWSNVTGESGYQVYFATKKNGEYKKLNSYKVNVVKGSKSKLTSGKTYYFKVRAYKKTDNGTVYSSWSTVKSVKIK